MTKEPRRLHLPLCLFLLTALLITFELQADEPFDCEPAPLFTLANLEGQEVSLEDHRGSVVILDFWATWCHLCVRTFPEVQSLSRTYADQGAVLLVVSLDKSGDTARDYLIENGFPTENVLWGSLAEAREVKDLFGVGGIAHTIVIDREGCIRFSGHPRDLAVDLIEFWLASFPDSDSEDYLLPPPYYSVDAADG